MSPPYKEILTLDNLLRNFPRHLGSPTNNQRRMFELIAERGTSTVFESPTGSGKTAVGYTVLRTVAEANIGPTFYIVPNKALVDQTWSMFPDMTRVYGRNEYDCLYYLPEVYKADEIPCLSLRDCPHRVDQQTGQTMEPGAEPCPYYGPKYQAKQAQIVVCTAAFYLFTHLFNREFEPSAALVVDEAHQIAEIVRNSLSYEISDWHVARSVELLERVGADEAAEQLENFLSSMVRMLQLRRGNYRAPKLLEDAELLELLRPLRAIDIRGVRAAVTEAVSNGAIDPMRDMSVLKQLETVTHSLPRYIRSFEFSRETEERHALDYVTYAFSEKPEEEEVRYRLVIKASYVSPIVRKLLSPMTIAYSATIGDPRIFAYETGIKAKAFSLPATFPPENALVFVPTDTPNLAKKVKSSHEPTKVLRKVAKTCHRLADTGARSLVIVVSNAERDKFMRLAAEENVEAITYGNGVPPREAMTRFKEGEATVLVGTAANYGEGIDLPSGMAPAIFFLRPGYPNPMDPRTQFEVRRFGKGQAWALWNWRVMIQALQVRGRNIRSPDDRGVTFFISQQFGRFVYASLPMWLRGSYVGGMTLKEGEEATLELLE